MTGIVLMRGGGDLASGAAFRLFKAGFMVVILELDSPLVVRRTVSFATAVYSGEIIVEGVTARRAQDRHQVFQMLEEDILPVLVDPGGVSIQALSPFVLVDARMTKQPPADPFPQARLVIGLGPGFTAGLNCHAVAETKRGPFLGRVLWSGSAEADTGQPDAQEGHASDRLLRAPADGLLEVHARIGDILQPGERVASVSGLDVTAPFKGILRGLLHPGLQVRQGIKIGDLDPRLDPRLVSFISDKALAVGGGVLEAVMTHADIRRDLLQ